MTITSPKKTALSRKVLSTSQIICKQGHHPPIRASCRSRSQINLKKRNLVNWRRPKILLSYWKSHSTEARKWHLSALALWSSNQQIKTFSTRVPRLNFQTPARVKRCQTPSNRQSKRWMCTWRQVQAKCRNPIAGILPRAQLIRSRTRLWLSLKSVQF